MCPRAVQCRGCGDITEINFYRENTNTASPLELQTKVREDFTITKKATPRAFSWLKVPTNAFTFKTLSRHYAKQVLTHGK